MSQGRAGKVAVVNRRLMPQQRNGAVRQPDHAGEQAVTYSGAELLAMARAAGAPAAVLDALSQLAPAARYHYLAELWSSRPEDPER
jgi:hypothetical protein